MKIEAYSEQKKAAAMYREQQRQAAAVKGSVSGAAITQAVSFTKSDNSMELFGMSNYASEENYDSRPKTGEEFADEAQALLDNMKAICNKMDTGELVAMDDEGIDVNDMDSDKLVTVGEQIRIKLAAAGCEHVYTADLDTDDIKGVLGEGSEAYAAKVLAKYNFPVTDENVQEIEKALEKVKELKVPDIQTKSYLMNNGLAPTVENLYKAEYAYSGAQSGVKLTDSQWSDVKTQLEEMLDGAGIESTDETLGELRKLVEAGTAITDRSLEIYKQAGEAGELIGAVCNQDKKGQDAVLIFEEAVADKMAAAMVDGYEAQEVNLSDEPAVWKRAAHSIDILDRVTAEALTEFLNNDEYERNLEGLENAIENVRVDGNAKGDILSGLNPLDYYRILPESLSDESSIHTLRCLEQIRLKLTFESAYVLEKNGISVNTEGLSKLVEELEKLEQTYGVDNTAENDDDRTGSNGLLKGIDSGSTQNDYRKFMYELGALKTAPCAAIGDAVSRNEAAGKNDTSLADIENAAFRMQRKYESAGEAYETMSTQVRTDLGDKLGNAVAASTENILKELKLEDTQENRRAVRILAYNSMDITMERLERVKEIDAAVNNLFERLTPDIALEMIRAGSDVMNMDIKKLSDEVDTRRQNKENVSTQKFSEFLYEQDKKGTISADDREHYMALYTIINKLTKDDGKAAGQLVNQELDSTLGNLVTSYMIEKGAGIVAGLSEDGAQYANSRKNNDAKLTYYKDMLSKLAKLPKEAASLVTENELPKTINNLAAAGSLYTDNAYFYKEMKKTDVKADLDRFIDNMDNKSALLSDYAELSKVFKEAVDNAQSENGTTDIAMLKQISNGMNVMNALAGHNTFYLPYDKENGTRAIRLSVVENSENTGSFTVDTELENGSHVSVNARVQDNEITAYVLADNNISVVNTILSEVEDGLKQLGFAKVRLSTAKTETFPAQKNGADTGVQTRKLFAAAKVFVDRLR